MRENTIKKTLLTALSTLFVVSATAGVATLTNAQATNDTAPSIMAAGASVRVKYDENNAAEAQNKNGIRFATYLKNVSASDIAESYALIIPTDLISGELTAETEGVKKENLLGKWYTYTDATEGEVLRSMVVLYDVAKASYSRNVTVETYVRLNDGTELETNYQDENYKGTRSLDSVAEMAKADTEYDKLVAETPQAAGILDAYDVNIAEGTFVDFATVELTAGASESAAIEATPAFWKNYYKNYNTFSVSVTVEGTVSDVTALKYVAADNTELNIPLGGLADGVAKQVPVDFNFVNNYDVLTGGKFVATIADGSATTVKIAPMKATTVETQTITEEYLHSKVDGFVDLNNVPALKDAITAGDILSVKRAGTDVNYSTDEMKLTLVGDSVLNDSTPTKLMDNSGDDGRNTTHEVVLQTATTKYVMTWRAYTKVFRTQSDLYRTRSNGSVYSFFDFYELATASSDLSKIYGDFILANDIYMSDDAPVIRQSALTWPGGSSNNFVAGSNGAYAFNIYFDGNGHKIDGATFGKGGMFGFLSRTAVIKGLALTNVDLSVDDYSYVFARATGGAGSGGAQYGATFEDIYVSVKEGGLPAENDASKTNGGSFVEGFSKFTHLNRVVVEISDERQRVSLGSLSCGSPDRLTIMCDETQSNYGSVKDVFVISPNALVVQSSKLLDASNKASTYTYTTTDGVNTGTWTLWTYNSTDKTEVETTVDAYQFDFVDGIYRYNDRTDMQTNNTASLANFETSGYWTVTNNVPTWGAAA